MVSHVSTTVVLTCCYTARVFVGMRGIRRAEGKKACVVAPYCSGHDVDEAYCTVLPFLVPLVTLTAATGERFHEIQNAGLKFHEIS